MAQGIQHSADVRTARAGVFRESKGEAAGGTSTNGRRDRTRLTPGLNEISPFLDFEVGPSGSRPSGTMSTPPLATIATLAPLTRATPAKDLLRQALAA